MIGDDELRWFAARYRQGRSIRQIAAETRLNPSSVHYRLHKAGVQLRPKGQQRGKPGAHFPGWGAFAETARLYEIERLSTSQIAELLDISHDTVSYRLRRAGVTLRTRGESNRIRNQRRRELKLRSPAP